MGDVVLTGLVGSEVGSEEDVLLVNRELELELELLKLRIVPLVLKSSPVLNDEEFEPPAP